MFQVAIVRHAVVVLVGQEIKRLGVRIRAARKILIERA